MLNKLGVFMHKDIKEILINEQQIDAKCKELGEIITKEYQGKKPILITVLKGAVVFLADIIRYIDLPLEMDFMVISSYGSGTRSPGNIKIVKDIDISLEGKDILIIEDILDSGQTLYHITQMFQSRNPASIKICTLLDKPCRRKADIKSDYIGFEVPDEFVVGYGLDYDERFRNLPYIGILHPEVYE